MKKKKALTSYLRDYIQDSISIVYIKPTEEEIKCIDDDLYYPFALREVIETIQPKFNLYYLSIVQSITHKLDRYVLVASGEEGLIGIVLHNNTQSEQGYGNFNEKGTIILNDKSLLVHKMVVPIDRALDGENMYYDIGKIIDASEQYCYEKIRDNLENKLNIHGMLENKSVNKKNKL